MTPRQLDRALASARRRRYLDGLPTAALWADVRAFMSAKGAKAPSVSDLLGPSPFADAPSPGRDAPESRRERYERLKANVGRYAAKLRAQREAEAGGCDGPSGAPHQDRR